MSESLDRPAIPRSIRHKRILDAAADQPEASLDVIASEVPSATPELVEQVIEQYGDPADNEDESAPEPGDSSMAIERSPPAPDELSEKEREILRTIADHPDAKQRELGEMLDISAPTVCNRVNSIPGFDWENRQEFVAAVFDIAPITETEVAPPMATNKSDHRTIVEQLEERIVAVEDQVETLTPATESGSVFDDPELVHKVAHACMQSEAISEREELEILKVVLR